MHRLVIMGAGGRDFHNFNVVYRDDPEVEVVAFTATQIPGIADRTYPASLAGPRYPEGIPIHPEDELTALVSGELVDEVVFAYSDVAHEQVMHRASAVLAAGADFTLLGPRSTMIESPKPVVAVCAVRTGSGKSQTSLAVGRALLDAGIRVGLIRHPMPYHDLEAIRVQRFETIAEIDASNPTIEEREEYERPVEAGMLVYAGVDYAEIVAMAAGDTDAIVWDGGNNDFSFVRPDLLIVVVDPLRPGDSLRYHPGEANLRMADVVLVNKVDSATPDQLERVLADVAAVNPDAVVLKAESPVTLEEGPSLQGRSVLVVEDGPSITHGDMPFGAGTVAARQAGATLVDPRPHAVGSARETLERFGHIGPVLPAMGYSDAQLRDLEATINATDCDFVVTGTPIDLARIIRSRHPIRKVGYELHQVEGPRLEEILAPIASRARG
jgi:predicted GTPase